MHLHAQRLRAFPAPFRGRSVGSALPQAGPTRHLYAQNMPRSVGLRRKPFLFRSKGSIVPSGVVVRYSSEAPGAFRISDTDCALYSLFFGPSTTQPDLSTPTSTNATLDFTEFIPNNDVSSFVVTYTNKYGLTSLNSSPEIVTVKDESDVVANPDAPQEYSIEAGPAGVLVVKAYYFYRKGTEASKWLIYLNTGVAPSDPPSASPVVVEMVKRDGLAKLTYTSPVLQEGDVGKVLVRTRQVISANNDSLNVYEGKQATATLLGPDAVVSDIAQGDLS